VVTVREISAVRAACDLVRLVADDDYPKIFTRPLSAVVSPGSSGFTDVCGRLIIDSIIPGITYFEK